METLSHATLKDADEVSCSGWTFSGNFTLRNRSNRRIFTD